MKKALYTIGIALAIAGCTKSEITENIPANAEISFSAGIATRVGSGDDDIKWATTDQIGIYTSEDDEDNLLFKISNTTTGKMTADTNVPYLFPLSSGNTRTYYAYHPYDGTLSEEATTITYDLTKDYSKYLLWATTTTNGAEVELQFTHQLPKVTFNLTAGGVDATSLANATVWLVGANATATFDIKSGKFTDVSANNITLMLDNNDSVTAYLLPTSNVSDNVKLWINDGSNTFVKSLSSTSWESGSSYEYDVLVGDADIELKDGIYYINSAKGLAAFRDLVNGAGSNTSGAETYGDGFPSFSTKTNADISGVLTRDIDLSTICSETLNSSWTPIGTGVGVSGDDDGNYIISYSGTFDGDGYEVKGLYISASSNHQGLFGQITSTTTVKNLGVVANVTCSDSDSSIGGMVGNNNSGSVINCYCSGSVSGNSTSKGKIGGIVGYNTGTIVNCYNTSSVSNGISLGGITGRNYGTITNCYSSGSVSNGDSLGGVSGSNNSTITNCYWDETIYGGSGVGSNNNTEGTTNLTGYSTAIMTNSEVVTTDETYYFYELLNSKAEVYNNNGNSPAVEACMWIKGASYPTLDFGTTPKSN